MKVKANVNCGSRQNSYAGLKYLNWKKEKKTASVILWNKSQVDVHGRTHHVWIICTLRLRVSVSNKGDCPENKYNVFCSAVVCGADRRSASRPAAIRLLSTGLCWYIPLLFNCQRLPLFINLCKRLSSFLAHFLRTELAHRKKPSFLPFFCTSWLLSSQNELD